MPAKSYRNIKFTRFEKKDFTPLIRSKRILLTGASGYLGTWLTHALTELHGKDITCLVRDPNAWRNNVESNFGIDLPWNRIHIIQGDLDQERFGLSVEDFSRYVGEFDAVVHCASLVNFSLSFARLQQTNKRGLDTLLHWCTHANLHVMSSNAIYPQGLGRCEISMLDELEHKGLTPYGASKWVQEKTLRTLGVAAVYYRLGNIGPHNTGAYNRRDIQMLLLDACRSMNTGIESHELSIEFTPLETVLERILEQGESGVVNIVNTKRYPLQKLHFPKMLPREEWIAEARDSYPVLAQLLRSPEGLLTDSNDYDCQLGLLNTNNG